MVRGGGTFVMQQRRLCGRDVGVGGLGGQQAPRTGLLTNGRMLWDGECVCVCVHGSEAAWGLSLILESV